MPPTTSRRRVVAAFVLALAAGAAALGIGSRTKALPGHHLDAMPGVNDRTVYVFDEAEVGYTFTDGMTMLSFRDHVGEITIVDVAPVDLQNATLLGRLYAGSERTVGQHTSVDGFPPPTSVFGPLRDIAGATLTSPPPGQWPAYELLMGFRLDGPGPATMKGVEVVYELDGRRYRQVLRNQFVFCVEMDPADCEAFKETW